jgi:hypothetical protein
VNSWTIPNDSEYTSSPQGSHNLNTFHRPIRRPCGKRGKEGPDRAFSDRFSNSPVLHSGDLENSHMSQPSLSRHLSPDSHFSSAYYGYSCLLFLILFLLPHPVAKVERPRASPRRLIWADRKREASRTEENSAQILREAHRFSTRAFSHSWLQSRGRKDSRFRLGEVCCRVGQERDTGLF